MTLDNLVAKLAGSARYLHGQLPVIVQNMPGAGHALAANYMAEQAPRDFTCIGCVQNTIPLHQVLDDRGVRFDARAFQWLGAIGESNPMTFAAAGHCKWRLHEVATPSHCLYR